MLIADETVNDIKITDIGVDDTFDPTTLEQLDRILEKFVVRTLYLLILILILIFL